MRFLHSSIAHFVFVHTQQFCVLITCEDNPPDSFLEYLKGPHPPPEGYLFLGGDITPPLCRRPFFIPHQDTFIRKLQPCGTISYFKSAPYLYTEYAKNA